MQVSLSLTKILTGVATSLIIGAIVGSFTLVRTSDSLVFRVVALELNDEQIKNNLVPRSEFESKLESQNQRLERIEKQLDRIESKL